MRKPLVLVTATLAYSLMTFGGGAAWAQAGFGQVKITEDPTPPATTAAAKASAGEDLSGVTVTAKRLPESQRDPTEVLCHEEAPIGSRFAKKVCATRRQYSERRQMDQEQLYEWTLGKPFKSN